jgi:hypothetical protein
VRSSEEQGLSQHGYGRDAGFRRRLFERVLAVPEGAEVVENAVFAPKRQPLSIAATLSTTRKREWAAPSVNVRGCARTRV